MPATKNEIKGLTSEFRLWPNYRSTYRSTRGFPAIPVIPTEITTEFDTDGDATPDRTVHVNADGRWERVERDDDDDGTIDRINHYTFDNDGTIDRTVAST